MPSEEALKRLHQLNQDKNSLRKLSWLSGFNKEFVDDFLDPETLTVQKIQDFGLIMYEEHWKIRYRIIDDKFPGKYCAMEIVKLIEEGKITTDTPIKRIGMKKAIAIPIKDLEDSSPFSYLIDWE